jgi:hypothetical protein
VNAPALAALGLALAPLPLAAQRGEGDRRGLREVAAVNVPYDGRFTFARIRYGIPMELGLGGRGGGGGGGGGRDLPWSHDYPRAERHFTRILSELSTIRVRTDASNVVGLDDPDLFKYPVAYLCEPGFWYPSDDEAAALRAYLSKGGFLIVDDFVGNQWFNFEDQLRRVLPDARLVPLTPAHPIFDSFYRIESLDYTHPYWGQPSVFYGVFEDNDPARRLMVIVNFNNDIAEYWEFSDTGMFPIDLSNEAYKLGVNYVIYALSR